MVASPDTEGRVTVSLTPCTLSGPSLAQFLYQREVHAGPSLMTYMQQRQAPAVKTLSASGGNGAGTVLRSQSDSATQGLSLCIQESPSHSLSISFSLSFPPSLDQVLALYQLAYPISQSVHHLPLHYLFIMSDKV